MVGAPAALAAARVGYDCPESVTNSSAQFTRPRARPMGGIKRSFTKEVTMAPKAAPMTTATARSTTLPRIRNALNSLSMTVPSPSPWPPARGPSARSTWRQQDTTICPRAAMPARLRPTFWRRIIAHPEEGPVTSETRNKPQVAIMNAVHDLPVLVARDQGFFRDEGLELEFVTTPGMAQAATTHTVKFDS